MTDITDKDWLNANKKDLLKGIRNLKPKAAKPVQEHKILSDLKRFENIAWADKASFEFARYVIQFDNEIREGVYSKEVLDDLYKNFNTIRDTRFFTHYSKMKAVILVASAFTTLKHSLAGIFKLKERWLIADAEESCRECSSLLYCRSERCDCTCHRTTAIPTTKGLQKQIRINPEFNKLFAKFEYLALTQPNDLCDTGAELIDNVDLNDGMTGKDKANLMSKHCRLDKCQKCQSFLDNKDNHWIFNLK